MNEQEFNEAISKKISHDGNGMAIIYIGDLRRILRRIGVIDTPVSRWEKFKKSINENISANGITSRSWDQLYETADEIIKELSE